MNLVERARESFPALPSIQRTARWSSATHVHFQAVKELVIVFFLSAVPSAASVAFYIESRSMNNYKSSGKYSQRFSGPKRSSGNNTAGHQRFRILSRIGLETCWWDEHSGRAIDWGLNSGNFRNGATQFRFLRGATKVYQLIGTNWLDENVICLNQHQSSATGSTCLLHLFPVC